MRPNNRKRRVFHPRRFYMTKPSIDQSGLWNGVRTRQNSGEPQFTVTLPKNERFSSYHNVTSLVRERHRGDHKHEFPYFRSFCQTNGVSMLSGFVQQQHPDWDYPYSNPPWIWGKPQKLVLYSDSPALGEYPCDQHVPPFIDDVRKSALLALYDKIDDKVAQFDLLSEVAELDETISFLTKPLIWMGKVVRAVWKKDIAKLLKLFGLQRSVRIVGGPYAGQPARVVFRTILRRFPDPAAFTAEAWLAYRYGVMPMVYSVEDALCVLSELDDPKRDKISFQVTLPCNETLVENKERYFASLVQWDDSLSYPTWGGVPSYIANQRLSVNGSLRVFAKCNIRSNLTDLLRTNSLSSFIGGVYEGVMFSFVLDWFYDISGWLRSMDINRRLLDFSGRETKKLKISLLSWVSDIEYPHHPRIRSSITHVEGNLLTTECEHFDRTPLSVLPVIPPELTLGIDKWRRKIDSVAFAYTFTKSWGKQNNISWYQEFLAICHQLSRVH